MADRPTIATIPSGGAVDVDTLNSNFTAIRDEFDNLVGRNGTDGSNNTLTGDIECSNKTLRNATLDDPASTVATNPDGSAGAPAFSFTNDTDTGMYLDATGDLGFSAGSHRALNILTGGGGASSNHLTITGQAVGNSPIVSVEGPSTTIGIKLRVKSDTGVIVMENDSGEEIATFTSIANPVNQLDITPAATGGSPSIEAEGGDTNVDITLTPKGTGGIVVGSATGGGQGTDTINCSGLYVDGVLLSSAALPRSYLAGLGMSNDTDTDHDILIAAGECYDNSASESLVLGTAITKQIDAAWVVGDDMGGLDTGSSPAANTWYYVWLIKRTDTGVVDALFSTSSTSPTMPTNYDAKRRIGAVLTNSSSNIIGFQQYGDEFWWDNPPLDFSGAGSATAQTISLIVPDLEVLATIHYVTQNNFSYVSPLSVDDEAPNATAAPLSTLDHPTNPGPGGGQVEVRTNSSGQIRVRTDSTSTVYISTIKWIDRRGRDD